MRNLANKKNRGFTLIELLVVISIISFISSLVMVATANARKKARTVKRLTDIRQIQKALELYYATNNSYPDTSATGWHSQCSNWGSYAANDVIPGLVPTYMAKFPADPAMITGPADCYLYRSDGRDYIFLAYIISENSPADYLNQPQFLVPGFDSGPNICLIDGASPFAWGAFSPGATCWQ